jgi:hypothetical protein
MGRPKCHSRPLGQSDELCIMVHFVFMMHSHWVSARGVLSVANIPSTFRFVLFVCSCGRERASGLGHSPSPSSASRRVPDVYTRFDMTSRHESESDTAPVRHSSPRSVGHYANNNRNHEQFRADYKYSWWQLPNSCQERPHLAIGPTSSLPSS